MFKKRIFLIFMIISTSIYGQKQNSYVFFSFKNDTIKNNANLKLFCIKSNKEEEIIPIENNLYLVKNKKERLLLKIDNKLIYIDLKEYKKQRFFNITLNFNAHCKGVIYEYKKGHTVVIQNKDCNGDMCDTLTFEFPQIVVLNGQCMTTVNNIFAKYIFD